MQGNTMHNIILCLGDGSVETMVFGNQNIKTYCRSPPHRVCVITKENKEHF